MTAYKIGILIISFLLGGAVLFHFIKVDTFFLVLCGILSSAVCVYLDTVKKTSDKKMEYYLNIFFGVLFFLLFCFLSFL